MHNNCFVCHPLGTQTIILEAKSTINRSSSRWTAGLCTVLLDWRDYYSVIYRHKVSTICIVIDVPNSCPFHHHKCSLMSEKTEKFSEKSVS